MRRPTSAVCRIAAVVGADVLVLDQGLKGVAVRVGLDSAPAWFSPVRNTQLTLGIGSGPPLLLAAIALMVTALFCGYLRPLALSGAIPAWIPGVLAGGAASNLVDRVLRGAIQDWLVTPWAVVNLADLAVVVGIVALVVSRCRAGAAAGPSWHPLDREWVRRLLDRVLISGTRTALDPA
jgi:lipoprotein signal peptidase